MLGFVASALWPGGFIAGVVRGLLSNPASGIAEGLGSQSLTLYGTTDTEVNGWAYGFFQSESLTTLDRGHGVILPNGVEFRVVSSVPEPRPICFALLGFVLFLARRFSKYSFPINRKPTLYPQFVRGMLC